MQRDLIADGVECQSAATRRKANAVERTGGPGDRRNPPALSADLLQNTTAIRYAALNNTAAGMASCSSIETAGPTTTSTGGFAICSTR